MMKIPIIRNKSIIFGYLSAVLSAALFGSMSTIAKSTLAASTDPILLSSLVYLVAAMVMTPIAFKSNKSNINSVNTYSFLERRDYYYVLVIALLGAVIAPILFYWS
jgi:drug/metabolite transporter (DMT)-like permease